MASPTASPLPSATLTPSPTPDLGGSPTATLAPTAVDAGTLVIEAAVILPLPVWMEGPKPILKVRLSGSAQTLRWRLFTRSMVLLAQDERAQNLQAGWNSLPLELPSGLASDAYYVELVATRDSVESKRRLVKLMVLR